MPNKIPQNEKSIIATLSYSDIFRYPLSIEEIKKYFIKIDKSFFDISSVEELLKKKEILKINDFFVLKDKSNIIKQRLEGKTINSKKLKIAKKYGLILSIIPSIEFIGISGSVAMENALNAADIDFFIITSENTLWITRLISNLLLRFFKVNRIKNNENFGNKICLNMFLDKKHLELTEMKNLYTAHEIAQILPLINKNNVYEKFITSNIWITEYLPNILFFRNKSSFNFKTNFINNFTINFLRIFENISQLIQFNYMRNSITNEKIYSYLLAFHPKNLTKKILKEYNLRIKNYKF